MNKLGELFVYYRKKGLRDTLNRVRSRYFTVLTFIHYRRDLREPFDGLLPGPDSEVVTGTPVILERERKDRQDLPREFYIDQTHNGKRFYLLYYQGQLAGICWVFTRGEYSRFFTIRQERSCELNYIITLPEFRGKKLSTRFTNYICEDLKHRRFETAVVAISGGNVSSLKTMNDSNFSKWKEVRSIFSFAPKTDV